MPLKKSLSAPLPDPVPVVSPTSPVPYPSVRLSSGREKPEREGKSEERSTEKVEGAGSRGGPVPVDLATTAATTSSGDFSTHSSSSTTAPFERFDDLE